MKHMKTNQKWNNLYHCTDLHSLTVEQAGAEHEGECCMLFP